MVFKLSDWGGGLLNNSGKTTSLKTGIAHTKAYSPPELNMENKKINFEKIDVFSLGMTMVNCCGVSSKDINHISQIENEGKFITDVEEIINKIDQKYDDAIKGLIRNMLSFNPHERIDIKGLIKILRILSKKPKKNEKK